MKGLKPKYNAMNHINNTTVNMPSPAVIKEWCRRVLVEFNSAQVSSQLKDFLIAHDFSSKVIHLCERVIEDEIRHAKDCLWAIQEWGVETPITTAQVQLPDNLPRLSNPVQTIVTSFVLGETSAVPLFTAMYNNAEDKAVRTVIGGIIKDEKVHSAFAWEVFDELLEKDFRNIELPEHYVLDSGSKSQVAIVNQYISDGVEQLNNMYANPKYGFRVSFEDARFGLMDSREYHKAWLNCYRDTIQPRFLQRGFQCPSLNR